MYLLPMTLLDILQDEKENEVFNVDDVIETANHFRCIDMIIDHAKSALTEKIIKELHLILKNSTSDYRKEWLAVMADYVVSSRKSVMARACGYARLKNNTKITQK